MDSDEVEVAEADPYADEEVEVVDNQGIGDETEVPIRYTITSYGADYPVDGLVKRLSDESILVPRFQRGYVWSANQASRFIESLLLGLPVPGIFLSKEKETQKLLVIDGQQRLRTLQYFYDGVFEPTEKKFTLKKVQKPFLGQTYKSLAEEDRRRLDDSILHATIVHQDQPSDDESSIYEIFERLNTGGVRLSPQEIRTCIYHGELIDLLRQLNEVSSWRAIYGPPSSRMRDQELILRFLALCFGGEYVEYMAAFLNTYAGSNRHLQLQGEEEVKRAFTTAIDVAYGALGTSAFRPRGPLNAAVYDAVMVGLARRLGSGPLADGENEVKRRYDRLLENQEFINATETGTAHQESVEARLALAAEAFADLE